MKKFDRLPPEQRRQEIQTAALTLFLEKGFAGTTMENIVQQVSLSKGGVYRLYPSTSAILEDLILSGMRMRNEYYADRVCQEIGEGRNLTLQFLVEMIGDSLTLYPEISRIYVEFLWEKQRDPRLQALYEEICKTTTEETMKLIKAFGAEELLTAEKSTLQTITELMNGAVLSIHVLGLWEDLPRYQHKLTAAILTLLQP